MSNINVFDAAVVVVAVLVFGLPLTLLAPEFSVWSIVPKLRVSRCHVFTQNLSWLQLNGILVAILILLFCLYLELRKRKLDELLENILTANQATDATLQVERKRQVATMKVCMKLLDASTEHYESLLLLRDDLRRTEHAKKQSPPQIEPSTSSQQQKSL